MIAIFHVFKKFDVDNTDLEAIDKSTKEAYDKVTKARRKPSRKHSMLNRQASLLVF